MRAEGPKERPVVVLLCVRTKSSKATHQIWHRFTQHLLRGLYNPPPYSNLWVLAKCLEFCSVAGGKNQLHFE